MNDAVVVHGRSDLPPLIQLAVLPVKKGMSFYGEQDLREVSSEPNRPRRNKVGKLFSKGNNYLTVARGEPSLEISPKLIINLGALPIQATHLSNLMSTFTVWVSLSSISSESIRVSFSGCSAALVVVTMKATGPFFSITTVARPALSFCTTG